MHALDDEFSIRSAGRPRKVLDGINIMLVDDSRSVSEVIRMMAIRSGARLRRADCLTSAARHLMIYRPDVLIIDLGLPDGNGVDLARKVIDVEGERPVVLLVSAADEAVTAAAAASVGADGFLLKPIENLAAFQNAILSILTDGDVTVMDDAEGAPEILDNPDPVMHDLENARDLLQEALRDRNREGLAFSAQFLTGVARTFHDDLLTDRAETLARRLAAGRPGDNSGKAALEAVDQRLATGCAQSA